MISRVSDSLHQLPLDSLTQHSELNFTPHQSNSALLSRKSTPTHLWSPRSSITFKGGYTPFSASCENFIPITG